MKYVRFEYNGICQYGILKNDTIQFLNTSPFADGIPINTKVSLSEVRLLPPCQPSKIVAVGLNYADHAQEMNLTLPEFPALFFKPPTAVIGPEDTILYPPSSKQVDYEGELAIVIGKTASSVSEEQAMDYIFGYTCLNDVTARDLQNRDVQWTRAKGFNTFAPIGPVIETELNPDHLAITTRLNGTIKQQSNTKHFIFKTAFLISTISEIMTLYPGDIITTGTPSGIGSMQPGDVVEVEIEGIGILKNTIKEK